MMERLTKRDKEGVAYWSGVNGASYADNKGNIYGNAITKLAEYEDLEEQGLLLRLPYPLGTKKIFYVEDGEIYYLRAERITVEEMPITKKVVYDVDGYEFSIEDIGKTLFLTEEEAEAKLKEMIE